MGLNHSHALFYFNQPQHVNFGLAQEQASCACVGLWPKGRRPLAQNDRNHSFRINDPQRSRCEQNSLLERNSSGIFPFSPLNFTACGERARELPGRPISGGAACDWWCVCPYGRSPTGPYTSCPRTVQQPQRWGPCRAHGESLCTGRDKRQWGQRRMPKWPRCTKLQSNGGGTSGARPRAALKHRWQSWT
jgi:hypothetical protein